jgi:hypothetical protein
MQVWPFKDPAYDLKKLTMERPAQAVPVLQEAAVQVCMLEGGGGGSNRPRIRHVPAARTCTNSTGSSRGRQMYPARIKAPG